MQLYENFLKKKILYKFKSSVRPLIEQFVNEQTEEIYVIFDDDKDYIKMLISVDIDDVVRKNIKKFIEKNINNSHVKLNKEGIEIFIDASFSQVDFLSFLSDLKSKLKKSMKRLKSNEYILF